MNKTAFARWVFLIAGAIGVLAVFPLYFIEGQFGRDFPPPISHPEFFYGFAGVGLAWQVAFLVIGQDPIRYRPLMLPSVIEKFSFAGAVIVLFLQSRVAAPMLLFAAFDGTLGVLFLVAWFITAPKQ